MPDTYFDEEMESWASTNLAPAIAAAGGDAHARNIINLIATKLPPIATSKPTVSGTPEIGQTLTGSHGTYIVAPTSYAYRWLANGSVIAGAISLSYVVQSGDGGKSITFEERGINSVGTSLPNVSDPIEVPTAGTMPYTETNTVMYKGESYTLNKPAKVGYALNGQPFIVSDTVGLEWVSSSTPSGLIGSYKGNGAEFNPRYTNPASQGVDEMVGALTGSVPDESNATPYNNAKNIHPANTGVPWAIPIGTQGRLIQYLRKSGVEDPVAPGWELFSKRIHIHVVSQLPPADAICPIFDSANNVQWVTKSMARRSVLRGTGYVTNQKTLAACIADGWLIDVDQPYFFSSGEKARVWFANAAIPSGYASDIGKVVGRALNAMHAEGAAGVTDEQHYKIITLGAYAIERERKQTDTSGAGQHMGFVPFAHHLAMSARDAAITSSFHAILGNEISQPQWVGNAVIGKATAFPSGIGAGYNNRWPFQEIHRNRAHYMHSHNVSAETNLLDSSPPTRYEDVSGATGLIGFNNMIAVRNGPGGVDGLTFLLNGGSADTTNPKAAPIAYWERYITFNNDSAASGSFAFFESVDRNIYNAWRDLSSVPRLTTTPDAFNPIRNQTNYIQTLDGGFSWNYTDANQATETVTRTDHRYTLDGGRSFYEHMNCGTTGTRTDFPRGVAIGVQNRRHSASGAGPWSVNFPKTAAAGIAPGNRFIITPTGTASGTPTWVVDPTIATAVINGYKGPLYGSPVPGAIPPGATLYATKGWITGNITGAFTYQWRRNGTNISGATGDSYVLTTADIGQAIDFVVTVGGQSRPSDVFTVPAAPALPAGVHLDTSWGTEARLFNSTVVNSFDIAANGGNAQNTSALQLDQTFNRTWINPDGDQVSDAYSVFRLPKSAASPVTRGNLAATKPLVVGTQYKLDITIPWDPLLQQATPERTVSVRIGPSLTSVNATTGNYFDSGSIPANIARNTVSEISVPFQAQTTEVWVRVGIGANAGSTAGGDIFVGKAYLREAVVDGITTPTLRMVPDTADSFYVNQIDPVTGRNLSIQFVKNTGTNDAGTAHETWRRSRVFIGGPLTTNPTAGGYQTILASTGAWDYALCLERPGASGGDLFGGSVHGGETRQSLTMTMDGVAIDPTVGGTGGNFSIGQSSTITWTNAAGETMNVQSTQWMDSINTIKSTQTFTGTAPMADSAGFPTLFAVNPRFTELTYGSTTLTLPIQSSGSTTTNLPIGTKEVRFTDPLTGESALVTMTFPFTPASVHVVSTPDYQKLYVLLGQQSLNNVTVTQTVTFTLPSLPVMTLPFTDTFAGSALGPNWRMARNFSAPNSVVSGGEWVLTATGDNSYVYPLNLPAGNYQAQIDYLTDGNYNAGNVAVARSDTSSNSNMLVAGVTLQTATATQTTMNVAFTVVSGEKPWLRINQAVTAGRILRIREIRVVAV